MTANFWESSHCKHWILDKEKAKDFNKNDRSYLELGEIIKARIYYSDVIQLLGKKTHLRQVVVATATVYFKRFYHNNSFIDYDPMLIAPTTLYLAAKVEECLTHACVFEEAMRFVIEGWPYQMADILEKEYKLLEELDFYLVVYHPYQPLQLFLKDAQLECCVEKAFHLVNDSFRTDLALTHHPYIIALACILLAANDQGCDAKPWFSQLNVDIKEVWMVVEEMLNLYELWSDMRDVDVKAIRQKVDDKHREKRNSIHIK
eukprot:CAMPEP_0174252034 /NCGR_PEP_ID=MMETSP0439-20130205/1677_1 /TAXON_ID=0 /ORGANISM="Stereomyxa ramosa, Strain Chinc5" /LENGTH=259 /DNA_ID=CAMNT_0015332511 /DNA_START=14 /DNA_END=790 /DNA_ORIENTATION=+